MGVWTRAILNHAGPFYRLSGIARVLRPRPTLACWLPPRLEPSSGASAGAVSISAMVDLRSPSPRMASSKEMLLCVNVSLPPSEISLPRVPTTSNRFVPRASPVCPSRKPPFFGC